MNQIMMGMDRMDFCSSFQSLTGKPPYAWQERLYGDWFSQGKVPSSIRLPTGTGKTRIMAIWLLGLAGGASLPRRLVWIVDRRVVVDQATSEAEKLRRALAATELRQIRSALEKLSVSATEGSTPLAISTLRGAFEDNGEWSDDPSRPAIIVGTVDIVGSRLLFSGYGDGRYHRPLHAGLLGQDTLVVLDEAHLSQSFEALLRRIEEVQRTDRSPLPPLHFLPLSATLATKEAFTLLDPERGTGALAGILRAPKRLVWHAPPGKRLSTEEFRGKVLERGRAYGDGPARIVVYLDRLKDLQAIRAGLSREFTDRAVVLTGTIRGHERDRLVRHPVFSRFLLPEDRGDGVVFLLSTSAGEVGIDLYADQMICDLVPVDRMIQRFGRVNRAGRGEATIHILPRSEEASRTRRPKGQAREEGEDRATRVRNAVERTESYLRGLPDVSPGELDRSPPPSDAFAPVPAHPPLRTWHLDVWSLTTHSREDLPVASWLRGLEEDATPDVYFAWREEVGILADRSLLDDDTVEEVFQRFRLLPRELLRVDIRSAREQLKALGERAPGAGVIVLSSRGTLEFRGLLGEMLGERMRGLRLEFGTVVLPVNVGGLDEHGMLDSTVERASTDVSSKWPPEMGPSSPGPEAVGDLPPRADLRAHGHIEEDDTGWVLSLYGCGVQITGADREEVLRKARQNTGLRSIWTVELRSSTEDSPRPALVYLWSRPELGSGAELREMALSDHLEATAKEMERLAERLGMDAALTASLVAAARGHDLGKSRQVWQEYAGNREGGVPLAKSTRYRSPQILGGYRHELGSVIDLGSEPGPLTRHLIAAHHGFGRPEFPDRAADREHLVKSIEERRAQLHRFIALQRQYGWWGLAYLEALLKAADARASQ